MDQLEELKLEFVCYICQLRNLPGSKHSPLISKVKSTIRPLLVNKPSLHTKTNVNVNLGAFQTPLRLFSATFRPLSPFFSINEKLALLRQTLHTHFSMDDLLEWRKLSGLTSLVRASPLPNSPPISRQQSTWASPRNSYTGTLEGCQPRRLSSVGWTWWF